MLQQNQNLFEKKIKNKFQNIIPEKTLDAPYLKDDYYLNLIDWGDNDLLSVCLG